MIIHVKCLTQYVVYSNRSMCVIIILYYVISNSLYFYYLYFYVISSQQSLNPFMLLQFCIFNHYYLFYFVLGLKKKSTEIYRVKKFSPTTINCLICNYIVYCCVTNYPQTLQLKTVINIFLKKFILFYLFIFGCVGPLLLRVGFLQLRRVGATLRCGAQASYCGGFSCCGAQPLGARASVVVAHRLSSCGS